MKAVLFLSHPYRQIRVDRRAQDFPAIYLPFIFTPLNWLRLSHNILGFISTARKTRAEKGAKK
jgi:hypothetical protein